MMNFTRRQFLAAAGPAFLSLPGAAALAEGATGGTGQDEFNRLFDGQTLKGWHTNEQEIGHGSGGSWKVERGAITGEQDPPGSGNGGMLMTDHEYGDFELLIDLSPDWGIDSGVFLRANDKGECFQVYVDYRDHGNVGYVATEDLESENRMFIRPYNIFSRENARGEVVGFVTKPDERDIAWRSSYLEYSATPQEWIEAWRIGQWNTLRIRCVGKYPRITTWINYTKIADFDGATCPHPRYDRQRMFRKLSRKGAIALQVHRGTRLWRKGAKCRWSNIRVKPL